MRPLLAATAIVGLAAAAGAVRAQAPRSPAAQPLYRDVAAAAGLRVRHVNGASPLKYFAEIMGSGGLFLDVDADGWSLDDKRTPLLPDEKLGPLPKVPVTAEEHQKNNLPDVLARWTQRTSGELDRPRTSQSFCVPKADIAAAGYDLSLNRYKEVVHEEVQHRAPKDILADLEKLEVEIQQGLKELEGMLK